MGRELCPLSSRIRHGPSDRWSPFPERAVASCDAETRLPWPCITSDLSRGISVRPLSARTVAASNWRRKKIPPCGKKKAETTEIGLQIDTSYQSPIVRQPARAKVPSVG